MADRAAQIAVLCGGVGAARLLRALHGVFPAPRTTAIVNVADDTTMHGLHISPDIDTVVYTLAGAIDPERGWGLAGETWEAMGALERLGARRPEGSSAGGTWFNLGDRDLATHLYRTARLAEGATLSEVTAELAAAWGLGQRILPVTDEPVRTTMITADGEQLGFQEYFVGRRHGVAVRAVRFDGAAQARLTDQVVEALGDAARIVIAPSNPIVSIGPLRAVPGMDEILRERRADVVAVSPIIAGSALKGPADRMLAELGHEASCVGVAELYAGIAGTLVIDEADADRAGDVRDAGLDAVVAPTVMSEPGVAERLGRLLTRDLA